MSSIWRSLHREEAIASARSILTDTQERYPFIEGLLVFGSRVDPKKVPGQDSDLDIKFVLEDRSANEDLDFMFLRKYSPVIDAETISESEFAQYLGTAVSAGFQALNYWEYFPRAVYYIGKLGTMNEAEANVFIQERLTSQEAIEVKKAHLESIKGFIKTATWNHSS